MRRKHIMLAIGCALALVSVGCSSSSTSSSASSAAGGIPATEQDFSISVSPGSATAGEVSFTITNNGPSTHEFVVVKSDGDKDPGSLKVGKDGTIDEDTLNVIDEQSEIAPGTAPTLTTNLDAGSYILICNLPGHYAQGMHVGFTVT